MFTCSNLNAAQLILRLETLKDIDMLGTVPKSTFTEFIRVLSLLSKSWNMNLWKDLFVGGTVDVGSSD